MICRRNLILGAAAAVFFGCMLGRYLDREPKRHYCDFRVYYKAAQDFAIGKNIYFRETEEVTPFKYSPFFALVAAPLSFLPIKAASAVFWSLNFFAAVLLFYAAFRLFDGPPFSNLQGPKRFWVLGLAVLCVLQYVFLVWDSGQVSIFICAMLLLALKCSDDGHEARAGALLAGAMLIKYMPVIVLPYLLMQKRVKTVFWTVMFTGLFLLLPAVWVGWSKNMAYLSSWIPSIIGTSLDTFSYTNYKNQSIISMVLRLFSPTEYHLQIMSLSFNQALILGYAAALALYAVVFIPGRLPSWDRKINYALLFICLPLFNPNAWLINFVALAVPFMFLIRYAFCALRRDWLVILGTALVSVMINLIGRDVTGKDLEAFVGLYSFTTWGSLILFAVLVKLKFWV